MIEAPTSTASDGDLAGLVGGDLVLHLHRLDDDEQRALLDLVALGDLDLEDAALQRRDDVVAGGGGTAPALRSRFGGRLPAGAAAPLPPNRGADDLDRVEPAADLDLVLALGRLASSSPSGGGGGIAGRQVS